MGCQETPTGIDLAHQQIHDLQQQNAILATRVEELQKIATSHQDLRGYLLHAQNCHSCKTDLIEYNQRTVSQGIDAITTPLLKAIDSSLPFGRKTVTP